MIDRVSNAVRVVMIPDIPKPGDLPLEEVKVSTYAFS